MDDKAGRRYKAEGLGRRYRLMRAYGRTVWTFWQNKKSTLSTIFLLVLLVVLLFGVSSQLRPPVFVSAPPAGVTSIEYSAFVEQVTAGNVQAVVIRGNEIHGLLAHPLVQKERALPTPLVEPTGTDQEDDYLAWNRYIGVGNAAPANTSLVRNFDSSRAVYTHMPEDSETQLMPLLLEKQVKVSTLPATQGNGWLMMLWRFLPLIVMAILLLVFFATRKARRPPRSVDERMSQIGKSRARLFGRSQKVSEHAPRKSAAITKGLPSARTTGAGVNTDPGVTFADVAGIDEVRSELEEIVQFLRSPERFDRLGARIPRGALLVGPPGTGKTLLAKAVAGEAGVPFFSMSASEFVEMFVGVGASRVRDLFNQARQIAPCVVFIDEIDAVGRKRSMRITGNDERDQTLNQLLVELDGFDARKAVVVLAATNRVDILDSALLRPGRFDRRITVSVPDRAGREAILRVHTRKTPLDGDVALERLARMTVGMTGADLANLVNEAALSAARLNRECINHECFEEALARVQLGALRPLVMSERERRIIAVHEGGHALVAYHLPEADTVNRVTILPRGQSLGVTQFTAEEDRYNYSRDYLMSRIAVGLGGRVAEELTFGPDQITTGAENDLQVVTDLARRMVTRWGMSEHIGPIFTDNQTGGEYALNMRRMDPGDMPSQARSLVADEEGNLHLNSRLLYHRYAMSPSAHQRAGGVTMMTALIDAEVRRIVTEGRELARRLLIEHADQLALLASTLLEKEQIDRAQFEALMRSAV
jgi:ATP-dependent metalloprotease FtsH